METKLLTKRGEYLSLKLSVYPLLESGGRSAVEERLVMNELIKMLEKLQQDNPRFFRIDGIVIEKQ